MEEQQPNPYASPAVAVEVTALPDFDPDSEIRDFHFGKSLAKWLLVCGISGAPSFFIAFGLGQQYAVQTAAMVLGILTFVAFYVYLESREWTRRKLMDRSLRISVRVGYITRVVISILFPVAMFPDMFCGMFSVGLTSAILGYEFSPGPRYEDPQVLSSVFVLTWFYLTTLVQGVMLNIVLGGYTMIVYAIALLIKSTNTGNQSYPAN